MKKISIFLILIGNMYRTHGQPASADAYIAAHKELAIREYHRTGVPPYVTLAQAVLESASGSSVLAKKAKNHFGVKSHEWDGPTYSKKGEVFRVYSSVTQSFVDHSDFLLRPRYSKLFELDTNDYIGWARGLKKAGYANDPLYAQKLIKIIERYDLRQYTRLPLLPRIDPPIFASSK